ncbi:hypothetical protein G6F68_011574 [Rhizopus microsporus]|nr:hypothetical protein G6F68_011574 [Rhizopus microsporus]
MAPRQGFSVALPAGLATRGAGTAVTLRLRPSRPSGQRPAQQHARALHCHLGGGGHSAQMETGVDHPG